MGNGEVGDGSARLVCGENTGVTTGKGSGVRDVISTRDENWVAKGFERESESGRTNTYCGGFGGAFGDFGGGGTQDIWQIVAICGVIVFVTVCGVFYGNGGVDAVDYAGGDNGNVEFGCVVCGAKNCTLAVDFDGGGVDIDDKSGFCDGFGVAVVIREFYRNNDAGAEVDEVFLWWAEAWDGGVFGVDDGGGDVDDVTDYSVLFWGGVANNCGGKFADFADVVVGDGAGVYDGDMRGDTWSGSGGGVVCDADAGFSYYGGGVVFNDAGVFGGD